ncbi:hypothetical protein [Psychrobacillus sp.]|uniref:hypothetical protein n=1 Tax=Psychrobacillus sp. TaxID=1871623 RepID=UPI0028BEB0ED|nr:hypothetical protein [Psychrobacillus sp.]
MRQPLYGLTLYIFLMLPPVATLAESVMAIHMHMQMPLFVIVGVLMATFFQRRFSRLFAIWNGNGIPGIILFMIIVIYWMLPRTMDEALTIQKIELFKFVSLPFLAGVPLRDSWPKLGVIGKNIIFVLLSVLFSSMAWLYIMTPIQLCNNYLIIEQKTLGWGFVFQAAGIFIYFAMALFIDKSDYE